MMKSLEWAQRRVGFGWIGGLIFISNVIIGQVPDKDPAATLEIGGAFERSISDAASSFGPAIAIEVTPIEKWLELEAGVTPVFRRHSSEWSTDLLFKKPWNLSEKIEFMAGVGPEWIHSRTFGVGSNAFAIEAAADFMFWPSARHRFGWYLEPAYDFGFGRARERSVGITGGLLIAIR